MGTLYLVPTPIGNLEDMTYRAVRLLEEVDAVLAEDTRKTGRLLKHYNIDQRLIAYHQKNEYKKTPVVMEHLQEGKEVALVSSAGMPGISDPGYLLVEQCIEKGVPYRCLPGATAFVPALVGSGLPSHRFTFEGFLPPKKGRKTRLEELAEEQRTMIFYESPHRLVRTLGELSEFLGEDRPAAVAKEISKMHEQYFQETLGELCDQFTDKEIKGEFVIIVQGNRE